MKSITDKSVDLVFSHAVLEHLRLEQLNSIIKETYRILKPGGCASHRINLKDHLGGGLDNHRFSKRTWESNFIATSGGYTNRLRASEITGIFREVGFGIIEKRENRWRISPINRKKLCKDFSNFPDDDILIHGLDIIL